MTRNKLGKPISQRQLRVGEMIKQSLGIIFVRNEAKVPNLETNDITVTEVKMSQDLKVAKAFVLPLGGENAEENLGEICTEAHKTLENHELFANITTWSILILTFVWVYVTLKGFEATKYQRLFLAFLTLIFISICVTGYLGGELVHKWNT